MRRYAIVTAVCFVCSLQRTHAQMQGEPPRGTSGDSDVTIVSLSKPVVSDEVLTWRFQIHNGSTTDIWLCDRMVEAACNAHMAKDDETLLVQRRLNLPIGYGLPSSGQYVRLPRGETRTELMSFTLPIRPRYALSDRGPDMPLQYANRLTLEIGYYTGDLPGMVLNMLCQPKTPAEGYPPDLALEKYDPSFFFGGLLTFLKYSEVQENRNEHVNIPYTWQTLKGENVLRLDADGLRIPYLENARGVTRPDLAQCTQIEMSLKPNALEVFFPYADERSLFNSTEREHLRSLETVTIKDRTLLNAFAEGLRKCPPVDAFVSERTVAKLTCYRGKETLMSLTTYDGSRIMNRKGQVFGVGRPRMWGLLPPEIQPLDLRIRCAANMRDLWYRLRLYHLVRYTPSDPKEYWKRYSTNRQVFPPEAFEEHDKAYPRPTAWCDAMLEGYRLVYTNDLEAGQILRCPGDEKKSRSCYAMNPNCRYDSPPDMVLLFEMKPGRIRQRWNQHGGPELFTFDNHDAKGGLVLLNDGTVKFIRTEEELEQLRWK